MSKKKYSLAQWFEVLDLNQQLPSTRVQKTIYHRRDCPPTSQSCVP